jgi:Transposase DDE domain
MRTVLASDDAGGMYRRRKAMVEPVFAQTKHNRKITSFQRRGRSAVRSEWRLITATHNLLKLHKHQIAAAGPEKALAATQGRQTAPRNRPPQTTGEGPPPRTTPSPRPQPFVRHPLRHARALENRRPAAAFGGRDSLDRSNQAASHDCFGTPGVTPTDGATAARLPRGCSTLAPPTGRSALPLARFTPGASRRAAVSPPSTRLLVLVHLGSPNDRAIGRLEPGWLMPGDCCFHLSTLALLALPIA